MANRLAWIGVFDWVLNDRFDTDLACSVEGQQMKKRVLMNSSQFNRQAS